MARLRSAVVAHGWAGCSMACSEGVCGSPSCFLELELSCPMADSIGAAVAGSIEAAVAAQLDDGSPSYSLGAAVVADSTDFAAAAVAD